MVLWYVWLFRPYHVKRFVEMDTILHTNLNIFIIAWIQLGCIGHLSPLEHRQFGLIALVSLLNGITFLVNSAQIEPINYMSSTRYVIVYRS